MSAAVFFGLLIVLGRQLDAHIGLQLPSWLQLPGLVLAAVGIGVVFRCAVLFISEGHGTPCFATPPTQLVITGPYRHTRNPIYVGETALLTGFAMFFQSLGVLIVAVLWFVFLYVLVSRYEEPGLKKRFGASYETYCSRVPRWLPAVQRGGRGPDR